MTYYPPYTRWRQLTFQFPPADPPVVFDDTTRPAATEFAAGTWIWNTDDNAPNFSDGSDWRDADGNLT